MRALEEFLGKVIIDAKGNELGKIDDIEVDLESMRVEALVVKGKGVLSTQFQTERLASLMKSLKITKTEDLLIPFEEVQAVGKYVILKTEIEQKDDPLTL